MIGKLKTVLAMASALFMTFATVAVPSLWSLRMFGLRAYRSVGWEGLLRALA